MLAVSLKGDTIFENARSKIVFSETTIGSHEGSIALVRKHDPKIFFFAKFEVVTLPMTGTTVTQVQVWRDRRSTEFFPQSITHFVFFEVLLPRFGAVMSDTLHTTAGMNFWTGVLSTAKGYGLKIAMADFASGQVHEFDGGDLDAWIASMNPWGLDPRHRSRRLIISR